MFVRKFFEMYCINPESDEPIFLLFDPIGKDDEKPFEPFVNGNDFARELLSMDAMGKKRIQIWINTEGGSVKEGFSICSAMLKSKTKVDTLNVGIAYSMGGVILAMGRKREAMDYSSAMCHMAYNPDGTEDKGLDVINQMIITALSERMGKTQDEVKKIMAATTFYTAEESKAAGLVDEVIYCNEENKPRGTTTSKAKYEFGKAYAKSILNKLNPQTMKSVAKALGLNSEASEDAILSEVTKILNKKAESDKKMEDLEAKAKKAADDLDAYKKEKEEEDKKNKKKAEDDEADKKAKAKTEFAAKAKNKIEEKIKERGLKFDQKAVDNYIALAGETEETLNKVVETLEQIPVTKTSAQMKKVDSKNANDVGDTGIPLIPAGAKAYEDGTVEAGDTKSVVDAINSFDITKYRNRKVVK